MNQLEFLERAGAGSAREIFWSRTDPLRKMNGADNRKNGTTEAFSQTNHRALYSLPLVRGRARVGVIHCRQPNPYPNLPPCRGKGLVEGSNELSGFNNPFERFER